MAKKKTTAKKSLAKKPARAPRKPAPVSNVAQPTAEPVPVTLVPAPTPPVPPIAAPFNDVVNGVDAAVPDPKAAPERRDSDSVSGH